LFAFSSQQTNPEHIMLFNFAQQVLKTPTSSGVVQACVSDSLHLISSLSLQIKDRRVIIISSWLEKETFIRDLKAATSRA